MRLFIISSNELLCGSLYLQYTNAVANWVGAALVSIILWIIALKRNVFPVSALAFSEVCWKFRNAPAPGIPVSQRTFDFACLSLIHSLQTKLSNSHDVLFGNC